MTNASDLRPTKRVVFTRDGEPLVLEIRASSLTLRPKGTRRGGPAEVVVAPGAVYIQSLRAKLDAERRERRKRRKSR